MVILAFKRPNLTQYLKNFEAQQQLFETLQPLDCLLPTAETGGWQEQRPVTRAGKTEESSWELVAWKLSLLP